MTKLENIIKGEILESLKNEEYEGTYICDLACEMYNNDYYIIGTYQAKEFIKENIEDALQALENYQSNFGEQYKDITDYEKLATFTVLDVAENIISGAGCNIKEDIWNDILDEDNSKLLICAIEGKEKQIAI